MISVEESCKKAFDFLKVQSNWIVTEIRVVGDMYVIFAKPKDHERLLMPVSVNKTTGKCNTYYIDNQSWGKLAKAVTVEIPERYKYGD